MASLDGRPLFPGAELRDLGIAWGMWRDGSFLVPRINGTAFAGEPPLLYWIITSGWSLFGVNDVWPRLISPLFGLSSVFMCAALARQLWPGMVNDKTNASTNSMPVSDIGALCGVVLMGGLFWPMLSTLWGSLPIAVFFLTVAFWGVLVTWRSQLWSGCIFAGLALGLGILATGPVILLYILPVMITGPLWGRGLNGEALNGEPLIGEPLIGEPMAGRWRGWYGKMLAIMVLAMAVGLLWLIPAVAQEDAAYRVALVERLFSPPFSDGSVSWWVFGIMLAAMMLPWVLWSKTWIALWAIRHSYGDRGLWFCILWVFPVVGVLFLWPGVEWSSVMLAMPGLSLITGFLFYICPASQPMRPDNDDPVGLINNIKARLFVDGAPLMGLLVALSGVLMIVLPLASNAIDLPWWVGRLAGGWGVIVLLCGLLIAVMMPRDATWRVLMVATISVVIVSCGYLATKPLRSELHGMTAAANHVKELQDHGVAIAFIGPYQGEFDFLGRLDRPMDILDRDDQLGAIAWSTDNNSGEVVSLYRMLPGDLSPQDTYNWWGRYVVFWPAESLVIRPALVLSQGEPKANIE